MKSSLKEKDLAQLIVSDYGVVGKKYELENTIRLVMETKYQWIWGNSHFRLKKYTIISAIFHYFVVPPMMVGNSSTFGTWISFFFYSIWTMKVVFSVCMLWKCYVLCRFVIDQKDHGISKTVERSQESDSQILWASIWRKKPRSR